MDFPEFKELSEAPIQFHFEGIEYDLPDAENLIFWIQKTIESEAFQLQSLHFIFCKDDYLYKINRKFLNHDTLTDVITFPYSKKKNLIEGDIYISLERIKENANKYAVTFMQELKRVMIHGVLHLCGYGDKKKKEKIIMRKKENFYLEKIKGVF